MDCSPPGSSIHEILQARILVAIVQSSPTEWAYPWKILNAKVKDKFCMFLGQKNKLSTEEEKNQPALDFNAAAEVSGMED